MPPDISEALAQIQDATVVDLGPTVAAECPCCGRYSGSVLVGLGPIGLPDELEMIGTFGFQHCGHVLLSKDLAQRCASILECLEQLHGRVDVDLLYGVGRVDHPGEF